MTRTRTGPAPRRPQPHAPATAALALALLCVGLAAVGCSDSDSGKKAPPPPPVNDTDLPRGESPPGVVLTVIELSGGSGPSGRFEVGDRLTVRYRVTKADGSPWGLGELEQGRILVSGPTFNYQRVLAERADLLSRSVANSDGSFSYRFADPLPKTYLPPYNDTDAFGPGDGELAGQPLLGGTYTVGLVASWSYTVDAQGPYRDTGATAADFALGGTLSIEPREVVLQANCARCHDSLRVHDGLAPDVRLCGLCHTSGAEDRNTVAGGTPGVSVDLRVLIHKLHTGRTLPTVLGVTTNEDGTRDYEAPEQPYLVVGAGDVVHDYSDVAFPIWPNLTVGMARDIGYSDLPPEAQAKEDRMLRGATDCDACHGDPDGDGPLLPPAQGQLALTQPTRRACGACHDDWVWDLPYRANNMTMPAQLDDSDCKLCHPPSGHPVAVANGHLHPLSDPKVNPGLRLAISALADQGGQPDGVLQPGERLAVTFELSDDAGAPVGVADLAALRVALSGPTINSQLLLSTRVPTAGIEGAQPYTFRLPEIVHSEVLGTSSADPQDGFVTARSPHWNVVGAPTEVFVETDVPFTTTLAADAAAGQNYVDLVDASGFERDGYVALRTCPDGEPELLRIQWVDGDRLWFSSPANPGYPTGLRQERSQGDCVAEVTLASLEEGVDYDLDEPTGTITEIGDAFGAGNLVVATYTSDFVVPDVHGLALNDGPDVDETDGKWTGKSLVGGTYTLALWGHRFVTKLVVTGAASETTTYRGTAPAATVDLAVGDADPGALEPYALIEDPQACYACHQDLWYHGHSRRGWDACIACHGTAGAEDQARYVSPGAPETSRVLSSWREQLHKIHMGADLSMAEEYVSVGHGAASDYPDNFSLNDWQGVEFPAQPGRTARCASCHGDDNEAWKQPSDRNHPTEQDRPVLAWRQVCGSCHDSDSAQGHFDYGTAPGGVESCAGCHGTAAPFNVVWAHASY
jgi:hypothetical protein